MIWTALFLFPFLVTPKPVDTIIRCVGCTYISTELPVMPHDDTIFVYHSLSQLPKDTTKRFNVAIEWRWRIDRDSVFHLNKDCMMMGWYDDPTPHCRVFDSLKTVWRFVPDSSITESEGRR